MLSPALFSGFRILEFIVSIPILGMLAWFVHPYAQANQDVPAWLLTLFIVSVLAAAWSLVTLWQFKRYRDISGPFIALIDLAFVGAFIAGIYLMRGISNADCGHLSVPLGIQLGDHNYSGGSNLSYKLSKPCAMLKAAWILAIIDCVLFFLTSVLSWTLYRSYKYGATRTTHTKSYSSGRRSGSTSTYSSHRRHHRHTSRV